MYKTGRQIYLSRWEIAELKSLVETQQVYISDELRRIDAEWEAYQSSPEYYESIFDKPRFEELKEYNRKECAVHERDLKRLKDLDKKLWYYVEPGEAQS